VPAPGLKKSKKLWFHNYSVGPCCKGGKEAYVQMNRFKLIKYSGLHADIWAYEIRKKTEFIADN
jgi:hypothetical protein